LTEELVLQSIPGEILELPISLDEELDTLSYLNEYSFTFNYNSNWFDIVDVYIEDVSMLNEIEITNFSTFSSLTLKNPVSREAITNGNEVIIEVETQLSIDTILTPNVVLTSKYGDICYSGVSNLEIESQVCAHGFRQIELTSPEIIEISSSTITALEDVNISVFNYIGSEVISNLILNKSESFDLVNYLDRKGLYLIKVNNSKGKSPIKYFHQ
jgi:hypothetical protein